MSRQKSPKQNRGTTLLEILVAVALLLIIFLFVTADLIQSSQAENVSATRSETMNAANYLLGVMRDDSTFWKPDWDIGPNADDPCGNAYPPYTDTILAPTWHPAPACTPNGSNLGLFPDLVGTPVFQYMWNAQEQGGDPALAQLTVWVQVQEGGRTDIYEVDSTRTNIHAQASNSPVLPTPTPTPKVTKTPCSGVCVSPTPTPTPSPKASAKPTPTPTPTPKPSPTPSGTFE